MVVKRSSSDISPGSYDEVVRLLAILARRGTGQQALIYELTDLGFEPKRVDQLVGTTPNTVSVVLYQRNQKSTTKTRANKNISPEPTTRGEQRA